MQKFWVRELIDGVLRVGGEAIKGGLKSGKISNVNIFFKPGTPMKEILQHLTKKGIKL